ncbi:hypothetical protein BS78_08G132100 [Paspalum vaginatum]|nr:hypothetical protein BS78_08G132100 [Paspalum vaginatum]
MGNRPEVKFEPSVWGEYFIDPSPLPCELQASVKERRHELVDEVRQIIEQCLADNGKLLYGMKVIYAIERLGVSYHYDREIKKFLDILNNTTEEGLLNNKIDKDVNLLAAIALRFQILRQNRIDITCDVFRSFMNEKGELNDMLHYNIEDLLSLYEASYLAKPNERFLESSMTFTSRSLLKEVKSGKLSELLLMKVQHALTMPAHRGLKRLAAKHFIQIYEKDDECDQVIPEFAKLDFHTVLLMHREEVKQFCLWYKELDGVSTLSYIRNRPVMCYFWAIGIIKLFSLFDDTYDSYGTLEELSCFNQAIQRYATERAPRISWNNFGLIMTLLTKTLDEFVDDGASALGVNCTKLIIKKTSTVPPLDDHLRITMVTTFYWALACISFCGMCEIECTNDDVFVWVEEFPTVIKNACLISRLMDDISGHETEKSRNNVSTAVTCYAKDHGKTERDSKEALWCLVEDQWKSINKEFLGNTIIPTSMLTRIINLARVMESMYRHCDGYTHSSRIKESVQKVLDQCVLH